MYVLLLFMTRVRIQVAFMDKLAVQQTLLIGFSMGGMVALYLEVRRISLDPSS